MHNTPHAWQLGPVTACDISDAGFIVYEDNRGTQSGKRPAPSIPATCAGRNLPCNRNEPVMHLRSAFSLPCSKSRRAWGVQLRNGVECVLLPSIERCICRIWKAGPLVAPRGCRLVWAVPHSQALGVEPHARACARRSDYICPACMQAGSYVSVDLPSHAWPVTARSTASMRI